LRKNTTFPKAGQVNARMLDFVDRVFEGWKLLSVTRPDQVDPSETLRCIELLEDAMAYTFHSHRILRHLLRLHISVGDYFLAEKNLELYVKLWEKAKETDLLNVTREMRVFRKKAAEKNSKSIATKENDALVGIEGNYDEANADEQVDLDTPTQYLETLCDGVRLYCKHMKEEESSKLAVKYAERGLELYEEYKLDDLSLKARLLRWKGISKAKFAHDGMFCLNAYLKRIDAG